ncbi:aKG-HExxH-type peptide beta-hydroxylase [Pseudonocardia alaniniphila]|uniref:HEXXH motif-containing putative peptide modification protein n=1 Tax=Pseudonocardia alaniniphila TaxID=75291 RepID=A0ABS9TEB1_9PSEU|nr:HEXXH motif-containing putative peptide modification protein [Pseudonocardia alaniniphila]MCH6166857.1 HEXXH motif-containing putative peptide modification protein [Pseudonocardia alaniniphila]
MPLGAADLRRAHAIFGLPAEVIEQRRVLYRTLLEMLSGEKPRTGTDEDILDNPATRGHLGAVLAGDEPFTPTKCFPLSELVVEGRTTSVEGCVVRLASTLSAREALAGAVMKVSGELRRHGADTQESALVTTTGRPVAGSLFDRLVDGIELAVRMASMLALDLLPHVSLFAVLTRDAAGRLGSASAREFPGLILLPEPDSSLEVAEALIHEGAHQKFFDLATTRALFGARPYPAPTFLPSWAKPGAPGWPVEQTFAAWHAYCCLSAFHDSLGDLDIHSDSLLPHAEERYPEIGDWLLAHGECLGQDGHALLGAVTGRRPEHISTDVPVDLDRLSADIADGSLLLRKVGERTLVARQASRTELFWIRSKTLDTHSMSDERST